MMKSAGASLANYGPQFSSDLYLIIKVKCPTSYYAVIPDNADNKVNRQTQTKLCVPH